MSWHLLPEEVSRRIALLAMLMKETDRLCESLKDIEQILSNWQTETDQHISDVKQILFGKQTDIVIDVDWCDNECTVTAKSVGFKGNRYFVDRVYIKFDPLLVTSYRDREEDIIF